LRLHSGKVVFETGGLCSDGGKGDWFWFWFVSGSKSKTEVINRLVPKEKVKLDKLGKTGKMNTAHKLMCFVPDQIVCGPTRFRIVTYKTVFKVIWYISRICNLNRVG